MRLGGCGPATSDCVSLWIDRIDVVCLPCASVHDVPDWRGCKLWRAIVNIPHESLVAVSSTESTSIVVSEGDGAATVVAVVEAANSADVDLEGVASKAEVRVLKFTVVFVENYL